MINKKNLKKYINSYGKNCMLRWGVSGEYHYLSNGYSLIKGDSRVFDTEIIGLLYKYFGKIPTKKDGILRNDEEYKEKLRIQVYVSKQCNNTIKMFEELTKVEDDYPTYKFAEISICRPQYLSHNEMMIYASGNKLSVVDRKLHELIDYDVFRGIIKKKPVPYTPLIFADNKTSTVYCIMPIRSDSVPEIINNEIWEYVDKKVEV
jgi:hypothetical protein